VLLGIFAGLTILLLNVSEIERVTVTLILLLVISGIVSITSGSVVLLMLAVDAGSLVIVGLSWRRVGLGYFMLQAFFSSFLWFGYSLGWNVGVILLLKCGGGFLLPWLIGLYSGLLWNSSWTFLLVSLLSYTFGMLSSTLVAFSLSSSFLFSSFILVAVWVTAF
jgi:hypothetical protein